MPENNTDGLPKVIHPMRDPAAAPTELTPELKLKVLKATAVQQALTEVVSEHRDEIIKRARAKLSAMGIEVQDDEVLPK